MWEQTKQKPKSNAGIESIVSSQGGLEMKWGSGGPLTALTSGYLHITLHLYTQDSCCCSPQFSTMNNLFIWISPVIKGLAHKSL